MKKTKTFLISAFCLLTYFGNSQTSETSFTEIPLEIYGDKIILTPEEDIIILGSNSVLKIDNEGNTIWHTQINTSQDFQMTDIVIAGEGEIYVTANIDLQDGDFGSSRYPGIMKLSQDGDSLWFKSPFVSDIDTCEFFTQAELNGINLMNNGNIIQTGNITDSTGNKNLLLLISDTNGETLHIYTGPFQDLYFHYGESIFQAENGNIYIAGYSITLLPSPYTRSNAILAGFNNEAELLFLNKYPEDTINSATISFSHIPFNGGILLSANNTSGVSNETTDFLHIDYNGNTVNSQSIGAEFSDFNLNYPSPFYINKLSDGGFLFSGSSTYTPQNTSLGILAKYNSDLNLSWMRAYGDTTQLYYNFSIRDAVEFEDGKIALLANIKFAPGDVSYYLIITDSNGSCDIPGFLMLSNDKHKFNNLQVYPNPAKNNIHISTGTNKTCNYRIIGLDGRVLKSGIIQGEKCLDISELSSGIAFITIDGLLTQKIVIQ